MSTSYPLVSVVTPVYNTEKYLAACIESVLRQTYENWEYIIVDNCSSDRSGKIARQFADKDPRIKIFNNDKFLDLMENWNKAMALISPESKYCKVVHADDWLFPECISKMIEISERHPTVGIVGSYRLDENRVNLDGLPYPSDFVEGIKIGRLFFLNNLYLFGSPTSLLIRSDLIREKQKFYNESNIHADLEICLNLLKKADFGFVHQVLTFTRRHNETNTTFIRKYKTYKLGDLHALKNYGEYYLADEEYAMVSKKLLKNNYRALAKKILTFENKSITNFHRRELKKIGFEFSSIKLFTALLEALYKKVLYKLHVI
jgi:glycosyltransferase involved in cell wall biosynthesis